MGRLQQGNYRKHLKRPEDFVVEEVVDPRFTRKYKRIGSRVVKMEGRYALCILKKKARTTDSALREVGKLLGIGQKNIGYAGLKDKFAVTSQYVTIRDVKMADIREVVMGNATLSFSQYTDKHISIGDLEGNRFRITLHDVRNRGHLKERISMVKGGFPNFFGPQRFGLRKDNHRKGLLVLRGKLKPPKDRAKFFVHAYQSDIFNLALAKCHAHW